MGKDQGKLLTAVDIGSAKTCAVIAEITEAGLRYRGHGMRESRGSRRGIIVDLDRAVIPVQKAIEEAENTAGVPVERAVVGIGGSHVRGVSSRGGISLGSKPREITREDVRHALERARAIALPADRTILHLLPQDFLLDDQRGIRDPAGMLAARLEVQVHVLTAASSAVQNVVTALNRAGVHVDDTICESLASADGLLRPDERELGVCLADIGAGSTELVVFFEGAVVHSAVVPIGGDHFTSDVAVGLRTPLADAENVKKSSGCALVAQVPEGNEIEVPAVGDKPSRMLPQRLLAEILEPRARELFEMMQQTLQHAGVLELCAAGVVLTGGGARLRHLPEVAEDVLHRPARVASPTGMSKMPVTLAEPEFASVLGMLNYSHRTRASQRVPETGLGSRLKALFAKRAL